jgi:hypothetical protein
MSNKYNFGNLYIIQEREFVNKNEEIYKTGRTSNLAKRICDYPKGSIVHFAIHSKNCIQDESELFKEFCLKFKARPDIGREYFEGNIKEMISTMTQYIISINLPITNQEEEDTISPENIKIKNTQESIKKDVTIVIMEYIDIYREELSGKTFKSKDLYQKMIDWIETKNYNIFISHSKMTRDLIKAYGIINKVHRFDDGIDQALIFPDLLQFTKQTSDIIKDFFNHLITNKTNNFVETTKNLYSQFSEYNINNKNTFTLRMFSVHIFNNFCKQDSGIYKTTNIGKKCLNGYSIQIDQLKTFLS